MRIGKLCFLTTLAVAAVASQAQTLHYSGDFNGQNALTAERNTSVTQAMTYDVFTVGSGGWIVNKINADFITNIALGTMDYEIRSGVSSGNGGTLVTSGNVAASRTLLGTAFGIDRYNYELSGLSINLAPGTYWLGLSAVGTGTGRAFWTTTSGANGVGTPLNSSQAFLNSSFFGTNFAPTTTASGSSTQANYSFRLSGQPVPEPATMLILGPAALAMLRRRKK